MNFEHIIYLFILSAFTGYELITKIPRIIHTPLMSGSNFIHGIVLIGSIIISSQANNFIEICIGLCGVLLATINIVGGYIITIRMLEMFKHKTDNNNLEK